MTRRRRRRRERVCEVCGLVFRASRRDARFCGDACRQRAHRDRSVTEEEVSVTEEPEAVTPDTSTGFELTLEAHRLAGSRFWNEGDDL